MAAFAVWRNFMKPVSERSLTDEKESPAMKLGLTDRRRTVADVFAKRLFPSQVLLPEPWTTSYWCRVPTRATPRWREHRRRYAV